MKRRLILSAFVAAVVVGCGGTAPPAETVEPASMDPEPLAEEAPPAALESEVSMPEEEEKEVEAPEEEDPPKAEVKEPEFTEGMSHKEAVDVGQKASTEHIPEEAFSRQLNPEVFAECKVPRHVKVELKFAVWDGRTVGVTVTTKPKSKRVQDCLDSVARKIEWKEKAKSISSFTWSM